MFKIWILLFITDAVVVAGHFLLGERIHFFDLDREGNLASLVAGVKLWILGTGAFVLGLIFLRLKEKPFTAWIWLLSAIGFFWIGLDDMMGIHERIGFVLNNLFERGGFYGESFNWLLYYSPAAALGALVIGALLFDLWKKSRLSAMLCGTGLFLWVASLSLELAGRWILTAPQINVFLYRGILIMEEAFEMVGADVFLIGIFSYLASVVRTHIVLR